MTTKVARIKADIASFVEEHPGATRGDLLAFVTGQTDAVRAVARAMAAAGELVEHSGLLYPRGWAPPKPPPKPPEPEELVECDRPSASPCYGYDDDGRRVLCGDERCFLARWGAAGRPMPIPDWAAAGYPSRREWKRRGGAFSFDVIDADLFADADCGLGNGWTEEACGRASCFDCRLSWPVELPELCGAPTSRGRLCRRPAGRCGLPGHERPDLGET